MDKLFSNRYATHTQLEAMTLSGLVCLMKNGYMPQYAQPLEVYRKPANTFTADFIPEHQSWSSSEIYSFSKSAAICGSYIIPRRIFA